MTKSDGTKTPVEVKTVVHEQDRTVIEAREVIPEGVLIVDEETYCQVARQGKFFSPDSEKTDYRPPLGVHGLKGEAKENVLKVLGGKK